MDQKLESMLQDLIWMNALIATELIQITENTSAILRKSSPPETCIEEHRRLRAVALEIAEKYRPDTGLYEHLSGHQ